MKKVLITGCSKGIGLDMARLFCKKNFYVIPCFRKKNNQSLSVIKNLKTISNKIDPFFFDLEEKKKLSLELNKIKIKHYDIDVLINNAGYLSTNPLLLTKDVEIERTFLVNFFSCLEIIKILSKNFIKRKKGSIINISSISGLRGDAGRSIYSASKAALINLTKSLAKELGAFNIRVNVIAPGLIDTEMLRNNTKAEAIEIALKETGLRRIGTTKDVAELAYFLASEKSKYITGQVYKVDGGW
jgi:3-oxoacyl-[acyl-carrier protein] reductase